MGCPLIEVLDPVRLYVPSRCIKLVMQRANAHDRILDREVPDQPGASTLGLAIPLLYRLDAIRGYNPMDIHRYKEYLQFISDRDEPLTALNAVANFPIINKPLLDLLGSRYLVQPSNFPPLGKEAERVSRDQRWRTIDERLKPEIPIVAGSLENGLPPFAVYENPEAFPRAFLVHAARPLPERARVLSALKQANFHRLSSWKILNRKPALPSRREISSRLR